MLFSDGSNFKVVYSVQRNVAIIISGFAASWGSKAIITSIKKEIQPLSKKVMI